MPEDVALREVRDGDLPIIFEFQREPEGVAMVGLGSRDRASFDEHWVRIRGDATNVLRTIVARDEVAGWAVSFILDGRRMVGYWLGRAYWGRGIASRAFSQFVDEIPDRPLWATVLPANRGSRRVLEKCGFVQTKPLDGADELLYVLE